MRSKGIAAWCRSLRLHGVSRFNTSGFNTPNGAAAAVQEGRWLIVDSGHEAEKGLMERCCRALVPTPSEFWAAIKELNKAFDVENELFRSDLDTKSFVLFNDLLTFGLAKVTALSVMAAHFVVLSERDGRDGCCWRRT